MVALQTCSPQRQTAQQIQRVQTQQLNATLLSLRQKLVYTGLQQLGAPYQYGGETPEAGFDCSGLIQYVYGMNGIQVPRVTSDQLTVLVSVPPAELQPADILMFKTGDKTYHAGIYLGANHMLHAPATGRKVTVSDFSNQYWQSRLLKVGHLQPLLIHAQQLTSR